MAFGQARQGHEVSTGSGSDRVTTCETAEAEGKATRSLPLPVLTPSRQGWIAKLRTTRPRSFLDSATLRRIGFLNWGVDQLQTDTRFEIRFRRRICSGERRGLQNR